MAFYLACILTMKSLANHLDTISQKLIKQRETLSIAESVTSGNLQAEFSLAKNATEFFQGGITAYNTGQKTRHLHIDPISAERTNCVSDEIARSMALGVCRLFSSAWGIAVTGYAAPVPALNVKNTLFAYYAIAANGKILVSKKIETKKLPMKNVQLFFVRQIIKDFANYLISTDPKQL